VLLHPAALLCLALWVANDHWFKAAAPGWVTGKLSDVAALGFAPLLPVALWELSPWGHRGRAWVLGASLAAFGAVMVGINLWEPWAWAYERGLGLAQWPWFALRAWWGERPAPAPGLVALTMDPTDLWTLPALLLPARLCLRAWGASTSAASAATLRAPPEDGGTPCA
jgi:hypothetical protein